MIMNEGLAVLQDLIGARLRFRMHLFTSNTHPRPNDMLDDYTECLGYGYQSRTLLSPARQPNGNLGWEPQRWLFSGPAGQIYGYYVTVDDRLLAAKRFTKGPYNVDNGDEIIVKDAALLVRSG